MRTELPELWHILVDKENFEDVVMWEKDEISKHDYDYYVDKMLVGVCNKTDKSRNHNNKDLIKDDNPDPFYDFGQKITYQEFKKFVLLEEVEIVEEDLNYLKELLIKLNIK